MMKKYVVIYNKNIIIHVIKCTNRMWIPYKILFMWKCKKKKIVKVNVIINCISSRAMKKVVNNRYLGTGVISFCMLHKLVKVIIFLIDIFRFFRIYNLTVFDAELKLHTLVIGFKIYKIVLQLLLCILHQHLLNAETINRFNIGWILRKNTVFDFFQDLRNSGVKYIIQNT